MNTKIYIYKNIKLKIIRIKRKKVFNGKLRLYFTYFKNIVKEEKILCNKHFIVFLNKVNNVNYVNNNNNDYLMRLLIMLLHLSALKNLEQNCIAAAFPAFLRISLIRLVGS